MGEGQRQGGVWKGREGGRDGIIPKYFLFAKQALRNDKYCRIECRLHQCGPAGMMGVCLEVQQYCTPAVILGLAALAVSTVHPPTFEILKCIAATLPVQAGYNHTARDVASGKIPPGWRQEAAWRARHKWAAQRLAHLLTDLYDRSGVQLRPPPPCDYFVEFYPMCCNSRRFLRSEVFMKWSMSDTLQFRFAERVCPLSYRGESGKLDPALVVWARWGPHVMLVDTTAVL